MTCVALLCILHTVPGLGGSQLQSNVDVSASLPSCDTNGSFSGLWISEAKVLLNRQCFEDELTYAA